MTRERLCLECGESFSSNNMVRGTKTNEYGDKEISGFLCKACHKQRIKKRSKILLYGALSLNLIGILLFLTIPFYYFTAEIILEVEFQQIIESFTLWGILFELFGFSLLGFRYLELKQMLSY